MRIALLSFALLWFVLLPAEGETEFVRKKGEIQGESYVNLRSGPDLKYPPKGVLRKGDKVTVEGEDGSWYSVSVTDGKKGHVHKTFVRLLGKAEEKEVAKKEVAGVESVAAESEVRTDNAPISVERREEIKTPKSKPVPVIKVLEGKEWKIVSWLGAALCIFIIGWICGGNYYLRRDRIRRSRLHF